MTEGITDVFLTPLARHILSRVADRRSIPRYGSDEWNALPDQDPRRAAAVIVAAEAWRDHCSPAQVALDLLGDLVEADRELMRRVREASWDVVGTRNWLAVAQSPTYAELQQRRGEAA